LRLVKEAKKGDQEALLKLVMDQKQEFYKLAFVYMKNQEDAMDVMQEMIVILYDNIGKLKNEEAFYSWSKTILVNCCKNELRKKKKVIFLEDIKEETSKNTYENLDEKIEIEMQVEQLKIKYKEVIKLRYYLDLDYKTIAELLKIPIGTVKSRLSIGLDKLKKRIGGELK